MLREATCDDIPWFRCLTVSGNLISWINVTARASTTKFGLPRESASGLLSMFCQCVTFCYETKNWRDWGMGRPDGYSTLGSILCFRVLSASHRRSEAAYGIRKLYMSKKALPTQPSAMLLPSRMNCQKTRQIYVLRHGAMVGGISARVRE